jgi:glycosyltransferase involved in cell wall biosynthesis
MIPISIAIATYNRAEDLRLTLRSIVGLESFGDSELLVVDNNSSDHTRAVTEQFMASFPGRVVYVLEERQGLSFARNRAVAEARHDVVAFLDDDVDVDPAWLPGRASAFASGDYAAVGGRAPLVYPGARPSWLGDRDEGYLTKVELGPERRPAGPDELYGVNLAIRKAWIERVGGFRTDLGRVGTCLIGSEETELLVRIADAGGALLYEPSAVVGHRVAAGRLRRRWFLARSYWGHRGEMRAIPEDQASFHSLARITWHIALAWRDLAWAAIAHAPSGEEVFHRTRVLVARAGAWSGLAARLTVRHRPSPRSWPRPDPTDPEASATRIRRSALTTD